jgi:hypothetical protein
VKKTSAGTDGPSIMGEMARRYDFDHAEALNINQPLFIKIDCNGSHGAVKP